MIMFGTSYRIQLILMFLNISTQSISVELISSPTNNDPEILWLFFNLVSLLDFRSHFRPICPLEYYSFKPVFMPNQQILTALSGARGRLSWCLLGRQLLCSFVAPSTYPHPSTCNTFGPLCICVYVSFFKAKCILGGQDPIFSGLDSSAWYERDIQFSWVGWG